GLAFHRLTKMLLDLPVLDTHGIKAMRREAVAELAARCIHSGALFDTELIARAHRAGLRLRELPVSVREVRPSRRGIVTQAIAAIVGLVQMRLVLSSTPRRQARKRA